MRDNVHDSENCRTSTFDVMDLLHETWRILHAKQNSFRVKGVKL